jgi:hypothetical protein
VRPLRDVANDAMTAADLQRAAQRYLATLRTVVVEPPPKP